MTINIDRLREDLRQLCYGGYFVGGFIMYPIRWTRQAEGIA